MSSRVYFSHPAVLCSCGCNENEFWESMISGRQNGFKKIASPDGSEFLAGMIDDSKIKSLLESEKKSAKYNMRILEIEEACLNQLSNSVEKAKNKFGSKRIGVCVGSCDNGSELSVSGHKVFFELQKFPAGYNLEIQGADYVATLVSQKFNLEGPSLAFSTACSSSAVAIIRSAQLIKSGQCDAVVAGGVDIASNTVLMGFNSLEAVSAGKITNPFSKNRCGITLGEAAAFFVLTRENLFETGIALLGYGESCDAYHMTSPDPEGKGAALAISEALKRSRLNPSEIDYINLHGTGTRFNDSMEAKAVKKVFGGSSILCSSTKPMTGHTLGAAGALETAVCFESIYMNRGKPSEQIRLPVHLWDGIYDDEFPRLNFAGPDSIAKKVNVCMSSSFAFGGANACLVIGEKID